MTAHGFGPPKHHNDHLHYVCTACGASRLEVSPGGPRGAYAILVAAVAFPTCESARAEAERIVDERYRKEREARLVIEEKRRTRPARLAAFSASYPLGFYWVRRVGGGDDGGTVAQLVDRCHNGDRHWQFVGEDADPHGCGYEREYPAYDDFDAVEILAGPLSSRPPVDAVRDLAFVEEMVERFGVSMRNVMNIVEATRLFDRNEWSGGRSIPLHRYETAGVP